MTGTAPTSRPLGHANRHAKPPAEPILAQIAGIAELFVWLLVLRGFFLPLFIIPTGSMAETLYGAYSDATCPNCGFSYPVGVSPDPRSVLAFLECPNCRWQQPTTQISASGNLGARVNEKSGDRIAVHGWPYVLGGVFGPRRWDVVVFRNPNVADQNYIKRLIGLPGETIEIIDGDIWVTLPGETDPRPARKPHHVQETLWIPRYDHDYIPRSASTDRIDSNRPRFSEFRPRWAVVGDGGAWNDLDTRAPRFAGKDAARQVIRFVTGPEGTSEPGEITDTLGYNAYERFQQLVEDPTTGRRSVMTMVGRRAAPPPHAVTDVRLIAEITFADGDGAVEFAITKYDDAFFARLDRSGKLTLEHAKGLDGQREAWGTATVDTSRTVRLSLGHADYHVIVEVNDRAVVESPASYAVSAETARSRAGRGPFPTVQISAERCEAQLRHVRVDHDQYYSSDLGGAIRAVQGRPIKLMPDSYLVLGDNSNHSADARVWTEPSGVDRTGKERDEVGSHLLPRWAEGRYQIGTVPGDQLIGRAFLVYWPGFYPVFPNGTPQQPDLIPDTGRIRWIH